MKELDADLQLQLGHVKRLKEKIENTAGDLKRLTEENERNEAKIASVNRRRQSLEIDLKRLKELESSLKVEVDPNILLTFDNPMEAEILTTVEFHNKMVALRSVLHDLLMRTSANYLAAHTEMEDQERDFQNRVQDAIRARNLLREELAKIKDRTENEMRRRCIEYENTQRLEQEIAISDAETWLSRSDSNRLTDQLAMLCPEPIALPCRVKRQETEAFLEPQLPMGDNTEIQNDSILSESIDTGSQLQQHYVYGKQEENKKEEKKKEEKTQEKDASNLTLAMFRDDPNDPLISNVEFDAEIARLNQMKQEGRYLQNDVDKGIMYYPIEEEQAQKKIKKRRPDDGNITQASSVVSSQQRRSNASTLHNGQPLPPNLMELVETTLKNFGFLD